MSSADRTMPTASDEFGSATQPPPSRADDRVQFLDADLRAVVQQRGLIEGADAGKIDLIDGRPSRCPATAQKVDSQYTIGV